ncbi:hypothetical protein EXU85_07860 [Spirosoma sp. KCTC 42546]|uniref:hypothetical protein n=1 Tax=Spirosoma sp. KCTC 42546 TaxID=2520506 RepID=UPI00115B465A|nr:hypothetical protein [Spirosoma sp. KCTC 42546]QDK78528.1 hypothetical protein EXU85_07860 [Spirosoma sp. KCTC 42546]
MFGTIVFWDEATGQGQIRAYGGSPKPLFSASAIDRDDFPSTLATGQLVAFDYDQLTGQVTNVRSLLYQLAR